MSSKTSKPIPAALLPNFSHPPSVTPEPKTAPKVIDLKAIKQSKQQMKPGESSEEFEGDYGEEYGEEEIEYADEEDDV
jgi:hypothetical protein